MTSALSNSEERDASRTFSTQRHLKFRHFLRYTRL
jgi:hypothetical protein